MASSTHAGQTVLLLGGTGRTGGRVLRQLVERGVRVRAAVRSADRLPADVAGDPRLTVVVADLLSMSDELVKGLLDGCDTVISCLGHTVSVQWVVVRPDSLKDGGVTDYALNEGLVDSLFRPGQTNMANVAHFRCELATKPDVWAAWRGKLPVIVNASPA